MSVGRTDNSGLALLFARHSTPVAGCTCHRPGYCPACGGYSPAGNDPEVKQVLDEASHPPAGGTRVIRKRLEA